MSLFRLYTYSVLILGWMLGASAVLGQNRTSISLEFEGNQDLRARIEKRASSLLTELNRASYFDDRPDLADLALTESGRTDVLNHWKRAPFRCPESGFSRPLVEGKGEGTFEIRAVPLLLEGKDGRTEEKEGVLVVDALGRVNGFVYQSERASASPETGTIVVRTEPSESTVETEMWGGTERKSPARFEDVPRGIYTFSIHKENYESVVDTTFTIKAGRTVEHTIQLVPASGTIEFIGLPSEVSVQIDGVERALQEGIASVAAGEHTLAVSKEYFAPWDTTVTVPGGETISVEPRLRREQSPFIARSDPAEATVLVNEGPMGTTPLDTSLVAGRPYEIRIEKDGHVPSRTMRVVPAPDSAVERRAVLTPVDVQAYTENARLTNVRARRVDDGGDLRYALVGESGETYTVTFAVQGPDGTPVDIPADSVKGAIGESLSPGPDKQIVWRSALPEGATVQLALEGEGGRNLFYIVGGAVAAGGGALAALLMSGGDGGGGGGGGGQSFPEPPGLPE